jgi:hypothetical protein
MDANWQGDGQPVTMAFGGDVNFPTARSATAWRTTRPPHSAPAAVAQQLSQDS